jgi:UDP-2,3-diacylglucosamine pyrophosphatase LpxH
LGDIFDLIRTKEWWEIKNGDWVTKKITPWSENQTGLEDSALKVLQGIIKVNEDTIRAIKELPERLKQSQTNLESVNLIYVPGNHDRLAAMPALWNKVKESFGNVALIKTGFYDPGEYRILAFHGHQMDMMNREDKGVSPMGDYISSLVTAIPYWIEKEMEQKGFSPKFAAKFREKMLRIDDVRPQSAILKWLVLEAEKEKKNVKEFVKEFIFNVLEKITEDPFFKKWIDAHDKEFGMYDEIFSLIMSAKGLLSLGKKFLTLDNLVDLINKIQGENGKDAYAEKLLKALNKKFVRKEKPFEYEVQQKIKDADCLVIGHTHGAKYLPLNERASYLNTGTWRKYTVLSLAGNEFVSSHRLTFVTVYKADEAENRRFEQWNALMKVE